jgi:hypothetical protein
MTKRCGNCEFFEGKVDVNGRRIGRGIGRCGCIYCDLDLKPNVVTAEGPAHSVKGGKEHVLCRKGKGQ